jgi:DNA (cytosine-5)-methyltransferase 3A
MKKIKVLSLFDGMSVAQQALKELDIPVEYYASEIDKYAIAVTQSNFPDTIQLGDVREITTIKYDEFVNNNTLTHPYNEKIFLGNNVFVEKSELDFLIGGNPCQDLSIAKKNREGLKGQRSGLFYEYVRIRDEVKPKYFILENVNSMPKEAKEQISEILGVEPVMINASLVSAQNRKRLFWIGKWNGEKYEQVEIPQPEDKGILLKDILEEEVDEKYFVKGVDVSKQGKVIGRDLEKAHSLMARDYKGFGNQSMTGVKRIGSLNSGGQGDRIYSKDGKSTSLSANGGGRGAKTGLYCVGIIPESIRPKGNYLPRERVFSDEGKFRSISTVSNQQPFVSANTKIRKLTPTECLRLQSLPDNYFDKATTTRGNSKKEFPISNTQRYKMCGNAFNCEVIKHILKNTISNL